MSRFSFILLIALSIALLIPLIRTEDTGESTKKPSTVSDNVSISDEFPDDLLFFSHQTDDETTENLDELNESLQDIIIKYRIGEQQKDDDDQDDDKDNDDDDDVNLQRILQQIGVSVHKKYRQKEVTDSSSSSTLNMMIQQLYQTLKQTQPELFAKRSKTIKDPSSSIDERVADVPEEQVEQEEEEQEEEVAEETVPLTPEMERANTLYHQGLKLINGTNNRQYDT